MVISPNFVELCMETPCWCPPTWAPTWQHVGAHQHGHQHGSRNITETSVLEFCRGNENVITLEPRNIKINTSSRVRTV